MECAPGRLLVDVNQMHVEHANGVACPQHGAGIVRVVHVFEGTMNRDHLREMMEQNMEAMSEQLNAHVGKSIAENMADREPDPKPDVMDVPFNRLGEDEIDERWQAAAGGFRCAMQEVSRERRRRARAPPRHRSRGLACWRRPGCC